MQQCLPLTKGSGSTCSLWQPKTVLKVSPHRERRLVRTDEGPYNTPALPAAFCAANVMLGFHQHDVLALQSGVLRLELEHALSAASPRC
jgi:hypothetical protein